MARHSKNKETAIRFLEFLTSNEAQVLYTEINYEFPVKPGVVPGEEVSSWGSFAATHCRSRESRSLPRQRSVSLIGSVGSRPMKTDGLSPRAPAGPVPE